MKKFLVFFLPFALGAYYESPWLGNPYEFEWLFRGEVAHFNTITSSNGPISYDSTPILGEAGLSFCLPDWQIAVAANGAATKKESFVLADGSALVRYSLLNDVSGWNAASMTLGLLAQFPLAHAIQDPSLLYSSFVQGEFQVSVGKEWGAGPYWDFRVWGMGALGAGFQGSPWIRGLLTVEKNFCDRQQIALWIEGREGFGQSSFPLIQDFDGYGPIDYSFADLHLRYTWRLYYTNWVNIEYMIRVGAENCPAHRQAVALTFIIPFGP